MMRAMRDFVTCVAVGAVVLGCFCLSIPKANAYTGDDVQPEVQADIEANAETIESAKVEMSAQELYLASIDSDGDGFLTPEEYAKAGIKTVMKDNGDGTFSLVPQSLDKIQPQYSAASVTVEESGKVTVEVNGDVYTYNEKCTNAISDGAPVLQ